MSKSFLNIWLCVLAVSAAPCRAEPERIAIFDPVFINSSPTPTTPEEEARLADFGARLRADVQISGAFTPVDTAPVALELQKIKDITACNGCEVDLAKNLGARYAMVAWVQKISNLILNMSFRIVDTRDGAILRGGSVDIRGNDDVSWTRGEKYLWREKFSGPAR